MQTTAIGLISEVEGKEVLRAAASVMKRLGKTQQIQLLSVLSDKGDKDGMGAVMSLISSRDEEVRSAAIETVGYLGGAESVTLLAQVAATSKGSVKEASREALARLKGKEVDAAIGERIQGADAAIKAELVHALGSRYASGQMAVLLKSAADSDRKVRAEAIKGLRDIAGQAEMSELVSLMSTNKSSGERGEIAKTISAAAGRMCDKEARADEVLKELGSVKDSEIKVSLLELLGKLGGDRAYSVLSKSMISEDEGVRVAAIKGLSAWEDARPADVLLASVMGGKSDREKVLSLRGYIALAGLNSVDNVTKMKMYRKAMELCPSVNEKRLVFSGLSGTKDFAAMEMAVEYLDDAQLQAESQSAVLKVAFLIRGTECGKVRPILQKVSKEAKSKSLKASADKEIGKIKGL
jgi:HEAT repeat protein